MFGPLVCKVCGAEFYRRGRPTEKQPHAYCSRQCTHQAIAKPLVDVRQRFWSKVDKNGPVPAHRPDLGCCWIWTAGFWSVGYGRFRVGSQFDGTRRSIGAHQFALEEHLGRPLKPGHQACHRCDNRACVRFGHLFEGTQQDNIDDMWSKNRAHPKSPQGEAHWYSTLTEANVRVIRERYAAGGISQQALADEYGVCQVNISAVVRRKAWAHVD